MKVMAQPGTWCPKEGNPREYIDDSTPQDVPETAYYMRLIEDGSLVRAPGAAEAKIKPKGGKN